MDPQDKRDRLLDSPVFELSSYQAWLAFERTLISLDQSLMSAVRTSLSLISFGFALTIFFREYGDSVHADLHQPARNFGLSLVVMGIALVTIGLVAHRRRFSALRSRMNDLHERQMLVAPCPYKHAPVAALALLLLLAGLLVILGLLVRIGPFAQPG